MELSKQQQYVVDNSIDKSVVLSCAASGKTRVLTEKVRRLLKDGVTPSSIAVITFTVLAASELRKRLGDDYKDGIFIGTIHSLANTLLRVGGVDTAPILDEEKFDQLFDWTNRHPECKKQFEWVLLDEAQDSTQPQFDFIFSYLDPVHFFFVGDYRQSIYSFRNAKPATLRKIAAMPGVQTFELNENYRNASNILSFAKRIASKAGFFDESCAQRKVNGFVKEEPFSVYEIRNLINNSFDKYSDWAVIGKNWDDLNKVQEELLNAGIPYEKFTQRGMLQENLKEKMESNTVKILTIYGAKGLEWKNVIAVRPYAFRRDEDPVEKQNIAYVAATRAKDCLYWMENYRPRRDHLHPIYKRKG